MAETSPYLLGLTIVVSLVHSVFEFLAFKNGKVCLLPLVRIRNSLVGMDWKLETQANDIRATA